ncbi:hypothetical protein Pcinc_036463 [Petrolisthes cinctipes]|uniref:Small ribosomal subunit protein uS5m n=1 Tax=Petrolisthes cinctipes TaxID=88211 RepID=A0AAE1BUF9_PETCI|nr:hypothetical protein Pcinc_036463 [Petrolisthes cinctipes]
MAGAGATRIAKLTLNLRLFSISSLPLCNGARCTSTLALVNKRKELCQPSLHLIQQPVRNTNSFFNRTSAEQLWKGVTSVSNAGKKKGRGKGVGKAMSKNLNRGQIIGVGEENIVWPGLNAPVIQGRELVQQKRLPKDEERQAALVRLRDTMGKFRHLKIDPLERGWSGTRMGGRSVGPPDTIGEGNVCVCVCVERGWSGTRMGGRSVGPPDTIGEDTFEGFDTRVLEFKFVTCMTAVFGRRRRVSIFVVTGNGNGLGGFALAKATTVQGATRRAKNKAAQNLLQFPLYNDHTVLHDFFSHFGKTKLYVKKMPEGYGLVCHRVIQTICRVIGIKDIYAKVEGSICVQNMTKAFIMGLTQQKTHQQLADEKHLHLVEFREENLNFPKVVASPQDDVVRTLGQIPKDEELDFDRVVLDGKVRLQRKKFPRFYTKLPGYQIYLKKYAKTRNQEKVKIDIMAREGEVRSFFADQHPECKLKWGKYEGNV